MINIVLWADLQCPFCYVGETNLQHAIEELGLQDQVRLDIKSREIHRPEDGDGDMEMFVIFQQKDGFTPEGARAQIEKINTMGREEAGLHFDFGKVHESNDHDAHRLYKLGRDCNLGPQVRKALHDAYFVNCEKLADPEVLVKAGKAAGLEEDLIRRMLKEGWYENEVANDEMEYDALAIESVPYFIVDQEVIPEHLTKDEFIKVLQNHLPVGQTQN